MPQPRHCLHCGTLLTERLVDGVPRPACAACPYVFFDSPVAVTGVMIRRGDEVLLVRHAPRPEDESLFSGKPETARYVLIAGFLEAFESAEDAAVREAKEETGLDIEVERVVGTYSCRSINKNMIFIACVAHLIKGDLVLSEELTDARWFPLQALPDWPTDWPVARAFADLLEDKRNTLPLPCEGRGPGG